MRTRATVPAMTIALLLVGCGKQLPPELARGFILPTSGKDQHGNPVTKREGRARDPDTGLPFELWLREPRMEFVLIPEGEFMMGSGVSAEEIARLFHSKAKWAQDEHPQHSVRITDPFYMAKYETTIGQVLAFLNATDERRWIDFSSPACPVKRVARRYYMRTDEGECWGSLAQPMVEISWLGGNTFCLWLTGRSGVRVQLPTEAQWEYACRAGTDTVYSFGNVQWSLDEYARVDENFAGGTDPVGQRKPNAWGLYDMHGNAWEWCLDGRRTYTSSTQEDPRGPESTSRMFRGGHWDGIPEMARSAARYSISALKTTDGSGFRVAFTIPGPRR